MNIGRGQYVGLLVTDTEFGGDHNRVAGGDVALTKASNTSGERVVSVFEFAVGNRRSDAAARGRRAPTVTTRGASPSPASWNTTTADSEWIRRSSIASA